MRRTDLDGKGRAGEGSWRVLALKQPDKPFTPADEPVLKPPRNASDAAAYQTPGDALRTRTAPGYSPVRTLASWADGKELGHGRYVTMWRRDGGRWLVIMDTGYPEPANPQ